MKIFKMSLGDIQTIMVKRIAFVNVALSRNSWKRSYCYVKRDKKISRPPAKSIWKSVIFTKSLNLWCNEWPPKMKRKAAAPAVWAGNFHVAKSNNAHQIMWVIHIAVHFICSRIVLHCIIQSSDDWFSLLVLCLERNGSWGQCKTVQRSIF